MMRELSKLLGPLQRRVRLMVTRGVVALIDDDAAIQLLQMKLLAGETRAGVERIQNYGFTSVPLAGAHAVMVSIGGNHDVGLVVAADDPRYRPSGLDAGDTAVYDFRGHRIHLTADGIVVDCAGNVPRFINAPKARFEMDIEATGEIKDKCDEPSGRTMSGMRNTYDPHTHPDSHGGNTGAPNQKMS